MSSLPECKRCGVYVHGGPCYCERCGSIENVVHLQDQVADLKRKLSDSIAREQEIERELEYLQRELWAARESSKLAFRDAAKLAEQVHQERAHAAALAGAAIKYERMVNGGTWSDEINAEFQHALTAYRNREEGNE